MKHIIFRLNFTSGIHLSKGKEGNYDQTQVRIHSDTLKSAIFVAALQLYGDDEINKDFLEAFQVSSAFPYLHQSKEVLYFLPKPKLRLDLLEIPNEMHERRKKKFLKKIEYIEWKLLHKVLVKQEATQLKRENLSEKQKFVCEFHNLSEKTIYKTSLQQHVNVSRDLTSDNIPFTIDKIYFNKDAGLYFILNVPSNDQKILNKIEAAIHLLSDSGLGTDKNTGGGTFTFEKDENPPVWEASDANGQLNLSLYCPEKSELSDLQTNDLYSYALTKRGGYIASPSDMRHLTIRKKSIYMFEEGSVFPFDESRIGKIEDLRPQLKHPENGNGPKPVGHPIYRDGRAIFLPITIKADEI
jgi:CRISPR-associated protein Csm4